LIVACILKANDNELDEWDDIEELKKCPALCTVYLERNPIQTQVPTQYRRRLMALLPGLKQIDATYTRAMNENL